jgi:hypothetical protein
MRSDGVVTCVVPVLVDINLAIGGPIGSIHPEGRPGTANRSWEMGELGDEETTGVLVDTLDSDTATAFTVQIQGIGVIDTNKHLLTLDGDETQVLGVNLASVVDITTGGINIVIVIGAIVALQSPQAFLMLAFR